MSTWPERQFIHPCDREDLRKVGSSMALVALQVVRVLDGTSFHSVEPVAAQIKALRKSVRDQVRQAVLRSAVECDLQRVIAALANAAVVGGRPNVRKWRSAVEVFRVRGIARTTHVSAWLRGHVICSADIQLRAGSTNVIDRQHIFCSYLLLDAEVPLIAIRPLQIGIGKPC